MLRGTAERRTCSESFGSIAPRRIGAKGLFPCLSHPLRVCPGGARAGRRCSGGSANIIHSFCGINSSSVYRLAGDGQHGIWGVGRLVAYTYAARF